MKELLLHYYPESPYAPMIQRAIGIKGASYRQVLPSPNSPLVLLLEHGPMLQYGADFYLGNDLAFAALERALPKPSLFPNGNQGMPRALGVWAERQLTFAAEFVASSVDLECSPDVPSLGQLMDDKPDALARAQSLGQIQAGLGLVADQIADGRSFLQGPDPGLADLQAALAPAFAIRMTGHSDEIFEGFDTCRAWEERLKRLEVYPTGDAQLEVALEKAGESDHRSSLCTDLPGIELDDAVALQCRRSGQTLISGAFSGAGADRFQINFELAGVSIRLNAPRAEFLVIRP